MAFKQSQYAMRRGEQGAVLIVTLITLLLVTLITFATSRSSIVNSRIAVAQEIKTTSFQAAESALVRMAQLTTAAYPNYCIADVEPTPAVMAPNLALSTSSGDTITGRGTIAFRRPASRADSLRRLAGGGIISYQFDLVVTATSATTGATTSLTRAAFVDGPAPQWPLTGYETCP